jgi:hypothetical protein
VVGVDIRLQPNYPFEFVQADALKWLEVALTSEILGAPPEINQFDAIHASPPCQAFTAAQSIWNREHPDLLTPARALLEQTGLLSVTIKQYSSTYRVDSIETLWAGSMGSLARTSAVVTEQTPEIQKCIRAAYDHLASAYVDNKELAIPISFKVAAGRVRAEHRDG